MKTLNVIGNHNGHQPAPVVAKDEPAPLKGWPTLAAVYSVPRLGFMENFFSMFQTALELNRQEPGYFIPIRKHTGAFWGQCLTRTINESMERDATDLIMTVDYDTVFTGANIAAMLDIMRDHPEIDALAPLQMHRSEPRPLFSLHDANGRYVSEVPADMFDGPTTKIFTAHMGCMMFRTKSIRQVKQPWFLNVPDRNGGWEAGRIDEDTYFWKVWNEAGKNLHLANRVVVGHMEMMIRWPNEEFGFIDQHPSEFHLKGAPEGCWR